MSWLLSHWTEVIAAAGALVAAASFITRLTPTPKDDAALAKIRKVLGRLSALQPPGTGRNLKMPLSRPETNPIHPDDRPSAD